MKERAPVSTCDARDALSGEYGILRGRPLRFAVLASSLHEVICAACAC